jgi:hypothetical protein
MCIYIYIYIYTHTHTHTHTHIIYMNQNSETKRTIGLDADGNMIKLALNSQNMSVWRASSGSRYAEMAGFSSKCVFVFNLLYVAVRIRN